MTTGPTARRLIEGLIEALAQQGFVSQDSNLGCEEEIDEPETEGEEVNTPEDNEDEPFFEEDSEDDEDEDEVEDSEDDEDEDDEEAPGMIACLPMEGLDDWALENLRKLVSAKGTLIKKALKADRLDIEAGEGELQFHWWDTMPEPDEVDAYLEFIGAITGMAREAKRVTAREKEVENEKYAFRCFLLRLGFVGPEYKTQRKILLRNLNGSSAFSSKEKADAFNQAQKARRDAAKAEAEMEADTGADTETENGEG